MRIPKDSWLFNKPIAHRGLWGNGVVENSRTAYQNAANLGYPIEIDLYQTKDGHLVSFHDSTLKRMTGKDGFVWDYTLSELKELRLLDTDETIPTFDEVLSIAEGKSPLLIELKNNPTELFVEKVVERLKNYKGKFAVQSFNPLYIIKIKKLAPEFIRGILSVKHPWSADANSKIKRYIVSHMALNFLAKPDFISYDFNGYPLPKRKVKNKLKLAWTITSKEDYDRIKSLVDNVIYEGFDITK